MNDSNVTATNLETASALDVIMEAPRGAVYPAYVGLDVHKDTIAVAVAPAGRNVPD